MTEFAGLLNDIRACMDRERIPFAVGGAFALAAHGHPRYTADLDLMVLTDDLSQVHSALAGPRYSRSTRSLSGTRERA